MIFYLLCVCHDIIMSLLCRLFFFKQKTAYEMRISDWSSDVCSSDLRQLFRGAQLRGLFRRHLRLCSRGRALPDGAFHLFPDQRGQHRPVRADADHRRQGLLFPLSGGLHRTTARREPASRRRGGADRKRFVSGKSVSVRVDLGGRRSLTYHLLFIYLFFLISFFLIFLL